MLFITNKHPSTIRRTKWNHTLLQLPVPPQCWEMKITYKYILCFQIESRQARCTWPLWPRSCGVCPRIRQNMVHVAVVIVATSKCDRLCHWLVILYSIALLCIPKRDFCYSYSDPSVENLYIILYSNCIKLHTWKHLCFTYLYWPSYPNKGPVIRKAFRCHDVIMRDLYGCTTCLLYGSAYLRVFAFMIFFFVLK